MGEKFNLFSYNCKGLRDKVKREQIFNYVREKNKMGFSFLQETHSAEHDQLQWELQWGKKSNIFLNHGQSNARGNAILFYNMEFTVNKYADDSNGRLQVMSIKTPEYKKIFY